MKIRLLLLFLCIYSVNLSAQTTELWSCVNWGNWNLYEGLIYKADGNGNCAQVVFAFDSTQNGYGYTGGLVLASNGLVYGCTRQGGDNSVGVLFVIDPATGVYSKLWDFHSVTSGSYPSGNLIQASNGKLYGFAGNGGTYNKGTLFEYDITLDTCIVRVHFDGTALGANPDGKLIEASNGLFYGVTVTGGLFNKGTLFEFDNATSVLTKKHDFDNVTTGQWPHGITLVSNGKIYGTTQTGLGAPSAGTVFDYDISTGVVTHRCQLINYPHGSAPTGSMVETPNGKLYGFSEHGGDSICGGGSIFEFDIATNTITHATPVCDPADTVYFNYYPQGTPYLASNGKIYGSTDWTFFEYDPATHTLAGKVDFDLAWGALEPRNVCFIEVPRANSEYVWPGDCNRDLVADNLDVLSIGLAYNDSGPARPCPSLDWVASACDNWTDTLPGGINNHHADANGDGVVNADDTLAIALNYGLVHVNRPATPRTGPTDFILVPGQLTVPAGDTVRFDIYLTGGAPVDSLYGVAFSLDFDSALVQPVYGSLDYTGSALGSSLLTFEKDLIADGDIHAAVSRTDHVNLHNITGILGSFYLVVDSNITSTSVALVVTPYNVEGILATGEPVAFTPVGDTVMINGPSGIATLHEKDFLLYPNPADDQVLLKARNEKILKLEITDPAGRLVYHSNPASRETSIDVSTYPAGLYTISVYTSAGTIHKKLMVAP